MTLALLAILLVSFATLVYVFYLPGELQLGPEKTRLAYLRERKDAVYENLRDLNFEFRAGKYPESDYQAMKTSWRTRRQRFSPKWLVLKTRLALRQ